MSNKRDISLATFAMAMFGIGQPTKIDSGPAKKEKENKVPKGLKPFEIDGKTIYAINEKNAIRKFHRDYY